ncbi:hypothetical protein [Tabrizicola soli]|uniref:Uncharacterized protein n=1 Tax=Tabrizicola soli TaxID=2185115 RepID=A0ABV7DZB4_9RHOB|nr:hypothetical protein [Tabrizicola soli]
MWPFSRSAKPEEQTNKAPSGRRALDADGVLRLFRSLATLGINASESKDKEMLVAISASKLSSSLEVQSGREVQLPTKGLFLMIASNHLSACLGSDFEKSALAAIFRHFDFPESDDIAFIIQIYNKFSQARAPFMEDVGNAVSIWCMSANETTYQNLLKRFIALDVAFSET